MTRQLNEIPSASGVRMSEYLEACRGAELETWERVQPQATTVVRADRTLAECGDITALSALCKNRFNGRDFAAVERLWYAVNKQVVLDAVAPSIAASRS